MFLAKYVSLDLYDEYLENRFIIDHKQLEFDKNAGWTLIVISEKPDETFSYHEYFCIHGDVFDIIKSTHEDRNIMWKFISYEPNEIESRIEATDIHDNNIQNKKRSITKKSTNHTLQKKRQKIVDYRDKSFDDFRLIIVDPPPKLDSE